MRHCQICGSNDEYSVFSYYHASNYSLYECQNCGHRFVDSLNLSQESLDRYYLNEYKTDDKPYSDDRLNSLAECVKSCSMRVLDIGGMDGELQQRLNKISVICEVSGVGDDKVGRYDGVILSHTLEHIYDISKMMERIETNLVDGGNLFIEVPIHPEPYLAPQEYDYHWQHINKFRVIDLMRILQKNGFDVWDGTPLPDYREYHCWRMVAKRAKV